MNYVMKAYPWSLVDGGPSSVRETLAKRGICEANIAKNYHAVNTLSLRKPIGKTFFARTSAYV